MTDRMADALPEQYRVERELGAGGMATGYAARDMRHDRALTVVANADHFDLMVAEHVLRHVDELVAGGGK